MPLMAFACPASAPTYGEAHEFHHCVTKCRNRCLSPYLLAAVASSNQRNHHRGKYISATSLAGCSRKLHLERTVDYAMEAKKVLYGYRGTVMHTVVEDATLWKGLDGKSLIDLGFLAEWHMKVGFCFAHGAFPLPEGIDATEQETWSQVECPTCCDLCIPLEDQEWFVFGGTLDGAEPLWEGMEETRMDGTVVRAPAFDAEEGTLWMVLHDLKSMKEYAATKFICGDDSATLHSHTKDSYFTQAQLYRYLAERSLPPKALADLGVKRIKFVEARLQGFSMGEFPYMGSSYMYRKHWKHEYTPWYIPVIDFVDDAWVETYIRERGQPVYDSLITEKRRGMICEPEGKGASHSWACDFCPFPGTDFCPNPRFEWSLLQQGMDPEEAFREALNTPLA